MKRNACGVRKHPAGGVGHVTNSAFTGVHMIDLYDEQRRYLTDAEARFLFATEAMLSARLALNGAPGPKEMQHAREQLDRALDYLSQVTVAHEGSVACEPLPEVGSWWRHRNVSPPPRGMRQPVRCVIALLPRDGKVFVQFEVGPQFDAAIFDQFWEEWQPRQGELVRIRNESGRSFRVAMNARSTTVLFQVRLDDGSWHMVSELDFVAHGDEP